MDRRRRIQASLRWIGYFGLMCVFCALIANRAGSTSPPAVRTAKCTIDIADGKGSDCTLIKANDEWILWMNSSSAPRSVHFKSDNNPFTEKSCWDVEAGARARSGPIALNAPAATYVAYAADAVCGSNPTSNTGAGIKVSIH
jgi:hypothetical protein